MSIHHHKHRAASSHATPISSQETSAGGDVPLTSVDGDQLEGRLISLHQELHGQSAGVVERLCQEIVDASQGQVQLALLCYQHARTLSFPAHDVFSLPVTCGGRTYGKLELEPHPVHPDQPVLPYQKARMIALICAAILYSLETAAYFQREYPVPVHPPVSLTSREQEILELMCRGYQRTEIATMLHISYKTVGKTCEKMYRRLEVHTEREVIAAAFRLGLSSPLEHLAADINLSAMRQEI